MSLRIAIATARSRHQRRMQSMPTTMVLQRQSLRCRENPRDGRHFPYFRICARNPLQMGMINNLNVGDSSISPNSGTFGRISSRLPPKMVHQTLFHPVWRQFVYIAAIVTLWGRQPLSSFVLEFMTPFWAIWQCGEGTMFPWHGAFHGWDQRNDHYFCLVPFVQSVY